jgi:hypothetical protein
MKTILRILLAAALVAAFVLTSTTAAYADVWVSGQLRGLQYVRQAKNVPIARFELTASDGKSFTLKQIAFDIEADGAWVNLQVERVRLIDEQGRQIAGPMPVWSDPLVCDCSDGRVIFTDVASFRVVPGTTRTLTVVADIDQSSLFNSIKVTYKDGDSDVISDTGVSSTARVIPRVGTLDTSISAADLLRLVPADYAVIVSFGLMPHATNPNYRMLNLEAIVEANASYNVQISNDLTQWQEIGSVTPSPTEILKEAAVGVVNDHFLETAYLRLRKTSQ